MTEREHKLVEVLRYVENSLVENAFAIATGAPTTERRFTETNLANYIDQKINEIVGDEGKKK